MRSHAKRIIVTIAIFLLIATAVCILPIPSRIDLKMTGAEVSEDGTSMDSYALRLTGWKRNYLFRDDTMKVDAQISGSSDLDLAALNHTTIFTEASSQWDYATWAVYFAEQNQMDAFALYLAKDQTWSIITVDNRQFAFSTNPDKDLLEYWDHCLN